MKILTYILAFLLFLVIVILMVDSVEDRVLKNKVETHDYYQDSTIKDLRQIIYQYRQAPQKVDTVYIEMKGHLQKIYLVELDGYKKEIAALRNSIEGGEIWDDSKLIVLEEKELVDSLVNEEIKINYNIGYMGSIFKFDIDYYIKQLKTIETKIIYEPQYINVPKPFYEARRNMYASIAYGLTQTHFMVDLMYYTKKRFGFGIGFNFAKFDEDYKWYSVKVAYKVF